MSKKDLDYVVFICRCEPPHKAHIEVINRALMHGDTVIILVGSANTPRTTMNPWTWNERETMIRSCFYEADQERLIVFGINDSYNDQAWTKSVQDIIDYVVRSDHLVAPSDPTPEVSIGLIGHKKDHTSYYLNMFPQYTFIEVENIDGINSSDIRTQMFELQQVDGQYLSNGVHEYINAFMNSKEFVELKAEYDFIQKYKMSWAAAPYAPTFVTVDAVVIQSGHVLLVRRKAAPGKGTWAIPGGFINLNETLEDGMIRELREETKLKVPVPVLKGSIKLREVFDNPRRSLRGRTITHAFLIELEAGPLPKVKGSDDAEKAKWIPLGVFEKMQPQLFEDHFHIVNSMIDKL